MVRVDVVAAKLAKLSDRTGRVRTRCPATAEALAADRDALELVSFNLMLAVQACADLASHLISDEGWSATGTLAGAFERLREHGVVSAETARALQGAADLRNVVAHGYSGVDPAMVFAAGSRGVLDLEAFGREVATWVAAQGSA
jgi:uncharacterized protein YutE (UPF0331/DUF86 family)